MTATCERPETSVRNASVLPSGELRGDMTRVIGPTRRLPFQVGGGASTCLPRNQWPRNAPPPKKARPRARTSANSRTRRALPAASPRRRDGRADRRWEARCSEAPASATWPSAAAAGHPEARGVADVAGVDRAVADVRELRELLADLPEVAHELCGRWRSAPRDPSRGIARSPSAKAAARGHSGRRAAAARPG